MPVTVDEGRRCRKCGSTDMETGGPIWAGHAGEKFVPHFRICKKCGWKGKIWLENPGP